jgi:hypothetical protein
MEEEGNDDLKMQILDPEKGDDHHMESEHGKHHGVKKLSPKE